LTKSNYIVLSCLFLSCCRLAVAQGLVHFARYPQPVQQSVF
jgi:hypothetical protein